MKPNRKIQERRLNRVIARLKRRYPHFYYDAGSHYVRKVVKAVVVEE